MYRRRSPSPSRHRHSASSSSSRRRSPSPRRRSPGPSRRREHSREREPRRDRKESDLPSEFCRDRDEDDRKRLDDNRNVLERMEKGYLGGPLHLLYRACKEQLKIKIWTRNFKEVRGICTGFVLAFDKHWNLALQDVDEICLKPKKGKTPYLYELKPGDLDNIPEAQAKVPRERKKPVEVDNGDEVEAAPDADAETKAAPDAEAEATVEATPEESPKEEEKEEENKVEVMESEEQTGGEVDEKPADGEEKKKKKRSRKKKKSKIERRHVNQLFIRGDNIVMLSIIGPR